MADYTNHRADVAAPGPQQLPEPVSERDGLSAAARGLEIGRVAGFALLVSVLFWWTGLRGWAEAQSGYLEPEAIGVTPFLWVLLIIVGGLLLVTRLVPHRSGPGLNVVVAALAVLLTVVLAGVNLAYGAADGISTAGWAMAGLSVAQLALFLTGVFHGRRRLG